VDCAARGPACAGVGCGTRLEGGARNSDCAHAESPGRHRGDGAAARRGAALKGGAGDLDCAAVRKDRAAGQRPHVGDVAEDRVADLDTGAILWGLEAGGRAAVRRAAVGAACAAGRAGPSGRGPEAAGRKIWVAVGKPPPVGLVLAAGCQRSP
jgi:hypothetical protein